MFFCVFFFWSCCVVCLNAEQVKKQLYPREDDLVLLWLPENTGAYANDEPGFTENIHFGCVVKSMLSNGGMCVCFAWWFSFHKIS